MIAPLDPLESSTDVMSSVDDLRGEEKIVFVPSGKPSRLQNLSASVWTSFYLGVRSSLDKDYHRFAFERLENATSIQIREESSAQAVLHALSYQDPQTLDDGMTLQLGAHIAKCLRDFGDAALEDLARLALRGAAPPDALSHAMRWVARLSDPSSAQERLLMLTRSLEAPTDVVRDGAALGLVALGAPAAIAALDAAIDRETNISLRRDLQQAAAYLRSKS
jgi:hypothetical protein